MNNFVKNPTQVTPILLCFSPVRYLLSLGQSLYSVYKTPQCNWECCLSVFLSAQDTNDNLEDATEDGDDFAVREIYQLLF